MAINLILLSYLVHNTIKSLNDFSTAEATSIPKIV